MKVLWNREEDQTEMPAEYPAQYLEGLKLFNDEEFFECHDVLEELWTETQGEEKLYIQGMIQASVALFHFGNENLGGARKLYHSAREKLEKYPSHYWGVDLERFLADFQRCFQKLLDAGTTYPSDVEIQDELVPQIHFQP